MCICAEYCHVIVVCIFPPVSVLYLTNKFLRNRGHKSCVIGCVTRSGVAYCRAVVYKHTVGNLIALRVIPAHKYIFCSCGGGGADRRSDRVGISVSVERSYSIIGGVRPSVAVLYLTNIGLSNGVGKPCVKGFYAFLRFNKGVFFISGNKLSAFIIPALKGIAAVCHRIDGYPFVNGRVVGLAAVLIICGVIIFIHWIGYASNLDRSAQIGSYVCVVGGVMHLWNKRLQPAPLSNHGNTLVDIGIGFCFVVIAPGYTCILTGRVRINNHCQGFTAIINLKILCLCVPVYAIKGVIAGYGMFGGKYQSS